MPPSTRTPSTSGAKAPARSRGAKSPAQARPQGARYVALLRGINVGGNNMISMPALKVSFEKQGFTEVATYIQSGNVVFESTDGDIERLTASIEKELSKEFGYTSRVVVVSREALRNAVRRAPKAFGKKPDEYRYDVIFLKPPLNAKEAMKSISIKDGVDRAFAGEGVIYFSRLIVRASSSHLSRFAGLPVYKNVTVRNWNTTTKLLALMDSGGK